MNSAMVSLNRFWMSSMLPMFAICSSSRIFSRRAFSSGVRFFLAISYSSCVVLLFYTMQEVYTNFGMVSLAQEKKHLYPLPKYPFDPCKRSTGRVDRFCTIRFDSNNYSVPCELCGREVSVKASPETVSIYLGGTCIAQHKRCLERKKTVYDLAHCLPLLE